MGKSTGRPRGRPPGSRNRLTRQAVEQAEADGMMPLDYLLRVMRDDNVPRNERVDAAKAAAPYVHHRLTATELTGAGGDPLIPPRIELVRAS